MHTRRAVGILFATLALVAAAPATAAAARPVSVTFERVVATLPTQAYPTVDLLHQDADGAIVVSRGGVVMRFSPSGELVARWVLPHDLVAAAASADGRVFARSVYGRDVVVFGPDGSQLASWAAGAADDHMYGLAWDPRGSLLISDDESPGGLPEAVKRFTADGRLLGQPALGPGPIAVTPSGTTWSGVSAAVVGFDPAGVQFQELGARCVLGGSTCESGTGAFGTRVVTVDASERGVLVQGDDEALQWLGPSGIVRFTCQGNLGGATAWAIAADGRRLLAVRGDDVWLARLVTGPVTGCARQRLVVSGVRARPERGRVHTWRVSATLSHAARITSVLRRGVRVPCRGGADDPWDPRSGCRALVLYAQHAIYLPAGRSTWRVRAPRKRSMLQLVARDPAFDHAASPFLRLRR